MVSVFLSDQDYKQAQVGLWQQDALKRVNDTLAPPETPPAGAGQPAVSPAPAADQSSAPPAAGPGPTSPPPAPAPAADASPPDTSAIDNWQKNALVNAWQSSITDQLNKGVGPVADAIDRIVKSAPTGPAQAWAANTLGVPVPSSAPAPAPTPAPTDTSQPTSPTAPVTAPLVAPAGDQTSGNQPQSLDSITPDSTNRDTFIQSAAPLAQAWAAKTGIPAEYLLAVNGSESNWGKAPGNELFGLKAHGANPSINLGTWEQGQGAVNQDFSAYPSANAAYSDFVNLISTTPRYSGAWQQFQQDHDPAALFQNLNKAGYATDPQWGSKIAKIASTIDVPASSGQTSLPAPNAPVTAPMSNPTSPQQPITLDRTSQFQLGLSTADAMAACGPAAAIAFARANGRNPTPDEALQLAKQVGWTPEGGMNGVVNEKKLLDALGVATKLDTGPTDWSKIGSDVNNGNPVILSTPGHYFTIDQVQTDQNGQTSYHVGTSGTDLKAGSDWMTQAQIEKLEGKSNGVLYMDHPDAAGPSVAESTPPPPPPANPVQVKAQDLLSMVSNLANGAGSAIGAASDYAQSPQAGQDIYNHSPSALVNAGLRTVGSGINAAADALNPAVTPTPPLAQGANALAGANVPLLSGAAAVVQPFLQNGGVLDALQRIQNGTATPSDMLAVGGLEAPSSEAFDQYGVALNQSPEVAATLKAPAAGPAAAPQVTPTLEPEVSATLPAGSGPLAPPAPEQPSSDVVTGLQNVLRQRGLIPPDAPPTTPATTVQQLADQLQQLTDQVNASAGTPGRVAPPTTPTTPGEPPSSVTPPPATTPPGSSGAPPSATPPTGTPPTPPPTTPSGIPTAPATPSASPMTPTAAGAPLTTPAAPTPPAGAPSTAPPTPPTPASPTPPVTPTKIQVMPPPPPPPALAAAPPGAVPPPMPPTAAGGAGLWDFIHAGRVGALAGGVQTITHIALNTPIQTAWTLVGDVPAAVISGHPESVPAEFVGVWNGLRSWGLSAAQQLGQPGPLATKMGGGLGAQAVETGLLGLVRTHPVFQNLAQEVGTNMELWRQAAVEATNAGYTRLSPQWQAEVQRLVTNPTPAMQDAIQSAGNAFSLRGPMGAQGTKIAAMLQNNKLGRFLVPMFEIGYHGAEQGIEAHPLFGSLGLLADVAKMPFGGGPYAKGISGSLVESGVTPLAQRVRNLMIGVGLAAEGYSLASQGLLTGNGPADQNARDTLTAQGWIPNAFLMGGRYVDSHVLGRVGWVLNSGADAYEATHTPQEGGYMRPGASPWDIFSDYLARQGQYFTNETFLRSVGQVLQTIGSAKDMGRLGEAEVANIVRSMIPQGAALSDVAYAMDPLRRQASQNDLGQQIAMGIPGLRDQVPAMLNRVGQTLPNPRYGVGVLIPGSSVPQPDPLLQTLSNAGINLPAPAQTLVYGGRAFPLTPQEQQAREQTFGQQLQKVVMPLANSQHFQALPPQQQYRVLQPLVSRTSTYADQKTIASIPADQRRARLNAAADAYGRGGLTRQYGVGSVPFMGGPSTASMLAQQGAQDIAARHAALQQQLAAPPQLVGAGSGPPPQQ